MIRPSACRCRSVGANRWRGGPRSSPAARWAWHAAPCPAPHLCTGGGNGKHPGGSVAWRARHGKHSTHGGSGYGKHPERQQAQRARRACAVVMWLPSTKHSSCTMAGEAPLQGGGGAGAGREGAQRFGGPDASHSGDRPASPFLPRGGPHRSGGLPGWHAVQLLQCRGVPAGQGGSASTQPDILGWGGVGVPPNWHAATRSALHAGYCSAPVYEALVQHVVHPLQLSAPAGRHGKDKTQGVGASGKVGLGGFMRPGQGHCAVAVATN